MKIGSRWVEITTRIGCSNMCHYCPQDLLLSKYIGEKVMSFDCFLKILSNIDKSVQIHFSGFAESFLTKNAELMMLESFRQGYEVVLFSTLVGFSKEKADFLQSNKMKFYSARIHEYPFMHQKDKEEFHAAVDLFRNANLVDSFEVEKVNSAASRGSSLFDIQYKYGQVQCNRFSCNVVVPNGDLYLCCSDWGLKHKLGNLKEYSYYSQEIEASRSNIKNLAEQQDSDLLCRKCEWAQ